MSRPQPVTATLTRVIAMLAFALVVHVRARAESTEPPSSPLSALSAARETTAPAATATPSTPLTQAEATAGKVAASEAAASQTHALDRKEHEEVLGLLNLGNSLTDRAQPDFEAAEIAFRQVLDSPKAEARDLKSALLGLAHTHRKRGDLAKAAAIYERFLADYPGDDRSPDALLELGRTLRDMGTYKLAIARFYSVINSTLKVPDADFDRYQVLAKTAQFEIAETHFVAGDYKEATKYYTKFRLLDVAPADRARAHFKAADSLRRAGDLDQAVTAFRAFIEQWPDDENIPEARYLLAQTLREQKRPQDAYVVALDLLRAEKARVASNPKRWLHWQLVTGNQLANEFFESGNTAEAQTIYSTMASLTDELMWRLPVTYQLGLCHERLGNLEKAREAFQTVINLGGAKPPAQFAELVQMASWRIQHLAWQDNITKEVNAFFDSTTGKQAAMPKPADDTAATP